VTDVRDDPYPERVAEEAARLRISDQSGLYMGPRCPRCGTPADATETFAVALSPALKARLKAHVEIVRHELGLASDGEALAEAARRLAFELNQG